MPNDYEGPDAGAPDELANRDQFRVRLNYGDVRTEEDLEKSTRALPGKAHAVLTGVKEHAKKEDPSKLSLQLEFTILTGENGEEDRGKVVRTFLGLGKNNMNQIRLFALRLGLVDRGVVGNDQDCDLGIEDWENRVNAHVVIEVEVPKKKLPTDSEPWPTLRYNGIYDVMDPRVADVPKDLDALQNAGYEVATPARPVPATRKVPAPTPEAGNGSRQGLHPKPSATKKGKAKGSWDEMV
jgi:hypothetical protein